MIPILPAGRGLQVYMNIALIFKYKAWQNTFWRLHLERLCIKHTQDSQWTFFLFTLRSNTWNNSSTFLNNLPSLVALCLKHCAHIWHLLFYTQALHSFPFSIFSFSDAHCSGSKTRLRFWFIDLREKFYASITIHRGQNETKRFCYLSRCRFLK